MNVDDAMEAAKAYRAAHEKEQEPLFYSEGMAVTLAKEVERLRAELAAAKAAGVVPVEVLSHIRLGLGRVVIEFQSELEAESFVIWLRDRTKERGEG